MRYRFTLEGDAIARLEIDRVSFDLGIAGRRALVTAGTKGVGAAVVEVLRENGAMVVTTARSVPDSARVGVHYIAADLTTADGCARVAQIALDRSAASTSS